MGYLLRSREEESSGTEVERGWKGLKGRRRAQSGRRKLEVPDGKPCCSILLTLRLFMITRINALLVNPSNSNVRSSVRVYNRTFQALY